MRPDSESQATSLRPKALFFCADLEIPRAKPQCPMNVQILSPKDWQTGLRLGLGHWDLDIGTWTLEPGHWDLDIGTWTLGLGHSLDIEICVLDICGSAALRGFATAFIVRLRGEVRLFVVHRDFARLNVGRGIVGRSQPFQCERRLDPNLQRAFALKK